MENGGEHVSERRAVAANFDSISEMIELKAMVRAENLRIVKFRACEISHRDVIRFDNLLRERY